MTESNIKAFPKTILKDSRCDAECGWDELMGKDLMMKTIQSFSDSRRGEIDPDFLPNNEKKNQAEVGDAVLVDFEGYFIGEDAENICFSSSSSFDTPEKIATNVTKEFLLDEPFISANDWIIILGNGDVTPGLEMAIRFLPLGAFAMIKCHSKYAYGDSGRFLSSGNTKKTLRKNEANAIGAKYSVPPNALILYRLHIRSIKPSHELNSSSFIFKCAMQKKLIGNDCYKNEWLPPDGGPGKKRALKAYDGASEMMLNFLQDIDKAGDESTEGGSSPSVEIRREGLSILTDCLNNIAAVHLRAKSYSLAKEAATRAIEYDSNNLKALCRAAKAAMLDPSVTFEESDMAICCAEDIDSDDKEVKTLRAELEHRKREYSKREKKMYSKMMKAKGKNSKTTRCSDQSNTKEEKKSRYDTFTVKFIFAVIVLTLCYLLYYYLVVLRPSVVAEVHIYSGTENEF